MSDLIKFVAELRSYDEGAQPADGWYVAYDDLQRAADEIERLEEKIQDLEDEVDGLQCGRG